MELCYKLEGQRFETLRDELLFFLIFIILPAALGPEVYSALTGMSTRNIKIIMFLGSEVWRVRKVGNLNAISHPIV
jgi:hypothetical protein